MFDKRERRSFISGQREAFDRFVEKTKQDFQQIRITISDQEAEQLARRAVQTHKVLFNGTEYCFR